MSKLIDILVIYQENGLPHEKIVEIPGWLSNNDFLDLIRTNIGESANILNLINLDNANRQKPTIKEGNERGAFGGRPERRSDSRPSFGAASRPYRGGSGADRSDRGWERGGDRPTGGYAGRSPRDGAKPGYGGFEWRPSRGSSRESRMGSKGSRAWASRGR